MVCTPKRVGFAPDGMPRYELSRMQTRCDCSRRICLAVSRSATRMALPQAGHRQTAASPSFDTAGGSAAASNVRQSRSNSRRRRLPAQDAPLSAKVPEQRLALHPITTSSCLAS